MKMERKISAANHVVSVAARAKRDAIDSDHVNVAKTLVLALKAASARTKAMAERVAMAGTWACR
jgi:hypothetical protein